ncbi:ATP-binding protein [Parapedobacter tibetensis]|uniref:ATP-binding protein n=1 Tax=Parapedobacter tibetensis TaxID=2972951 RepID=UPI00214DBB39|nr:ATP-binding protein [Parapedobacter tibetensis]
MQKPILQDALTILLRKTEQLVNFRLCQFFAISDAVPNEQADFAIGDDGFYCSNLLLRSSDIEKTIIMLSLAPHLHPAFYDRIIQQFLPNGGDIIELGGVKNVGNHRGFLPTGETALFIIAGDDMEKRIHIQSLLMGESQLVKEGILSVESVKEGEPPMSGKLVLSREWLSKLLLGKEQPPAFGPDFPAKAVSTLLDWEHLVISDKTREQLNDIKTWLQHNTELISKWEMQKVIKPGYRALFYGPSGTGKTLTATLLGKEFDREVFRIDLSQVVSKYIGETEKNLEKIFQRAENRDWILFFDEADALFGKRSNVQSAHDKYANQEVSYLLQRVEDFPGLVILASNFKNNIDKAFVRRFNAIIHFPMPTVAERLKLWETILPAKANLDKDVHIKEIAEKYELNGSAIVQVVHFAALKVFARQNGAISKKDIMAGIRREFEKEDRVFK